MFFRAFSMFRTPIFASWTATGTQKWFHFEKLCPSESNFRARKPFRRLAKVFQSSENHIDFGLLDSLGNPKIGFWDLPESFRKLFPSTLELPRSILKLPESILELWTFILDLWGSILQLRDPIWLPRGSILELRRASRALGKPSRTDFRKLSKTTDPKFRLQDCLRDPKMAPFSKMASFGKQFPRNFVPRKAFRGLRTTFRRFVGLQKLCNPPRINARQRDAEVFSYVKVHPYD